MEGKLFVWRDSSLSGEIWVGKLHALHWHVRIALHLAGFHEFSLASGKSKRGSPSFMTVNEHNNMQGAAIDCTGKGTRSKMENTWLMESGVDWRWSGCDCGLLLSRNSYK